MSGIQDIFKDSGRKTNSRVSAGETWPSKQQQCSWSVLGLKRGVQGATVLPMGHVPSPRGCHHGLDLTTVLLTEHKLGGISQGMEGGFWGSGNFAAWMCWTQLWFYLSAGGNARKSPSWRCEVLGWSPTAAMGKAGVRGNKQEMWQCTVGTCYLQYSPACGPHVPLWLLGTWWWPCLPG